MPAIIHKKVGCFVFRLRVFSYEPGVEVNRVESFSSVSPLFCDIKMFCAPFACVQGRESRLHLSQRDTTEKSECKTLISPDPDEGSLQSQRETPRSQDSHWFTSLKHKKQMQLFRLLNRVWLCTGKSGCAVAAVCMCALYRWLVCLCMSERMQIGKKKAGCHCGWCSEERKPPSVA